MSDNQDWLDKLYLRDLLAFLSDTLSKLFPKTTSKISATSQSEDKVVYIEKAVVAEQPRGWFGFIKSMFTILGASVFLVASPLLFTYLTKEIMASKYFRKQKDDLAGSGIVVTGCDSGIGIETVAVLSAELPEVIVFAGCLTVAGVDRLKSIGRHNLVPAKVDVTSELEVQSFVGMVRSRLAGKKLYAIVNNAGIFDGSFVEVTPVETYSGVMDVNFFGTVRVTKAFLPLLARGDSRRGDGGRVLNVGSLASMLTSPGNTAYSAAKTALASYSDGLRQEMAEFGIKAMSLAWILAEGPECR